MRFGRRPKVDAVQMDDSTPLVRTWFGDDRAWDSLIEAVGTPSDDGFLAVVRLIDEQSNSGALPSALAALLATQDEYSIVIAADERAMREPDRPLLVVLANGNGRPQTMRVVVSELWGIENNMRLANMEWDAFASSTDADGVFRGFSD